MVAGLLHRVNPQHKEAMMGKGKTVKFEWDGKSYNIPKMRLKRIKEFMGHQRTIASPEVDELERFEAIEGLLGAANCPEEVIDDLAADELQACMDALSRAHFPSAGDDSGNVGADREVTH